MTKSGSLAFLSRNRIAGGTAILALTQLGASIAGLLRDRILNGTFAGNFGVVDAYTAAFRPSDLLFQACIVSALGTVLVPILAGHRAHDRHDDASDVLFGTVGLGAVVFGIIALVLSLLLPWIAPAFVQFHGETLSLYIHFGQLALLSNFLFVFGNAFGQYLVAVERYWIYGLTPILYTVSTILGTLYLTPILGAYGPIIGTVLGSLLYVILRFIAVISAGAKPSLRLWHPDLKQMGILMLPRTLSLGAFQIQLLFLDRLASGFPEGSVLINANARNFQSVLVGVVGISLAQAVYSRLSQAAATRDTVRFRHLYRTSILMALALTIPGSILLVFAAPIAAWLVKLTPVLGTFTACLTIYALSIPFESISHVQLRAFYAFQKTLIPALFGVLGGAAAILVAWMLSAQYGLLSIAFGYLAGEVVQTMGLAFLSPVTAGIATAAGEQER